MANKEPKAQRDEDSAQQPRQHTTPSSREQRSKTVEDHLKEREKISAKMTKGR
jgi:hypothetical protein